MADTPVHIPYRISEATSEDPAHPAHQIAFDYT